MIDVRILLTNDDGIDAPGLAALRNVIELALGDRVDQIFTVAPDCQRSECGHGVSSGKPLRIVATGPGAWATSGTPVDCVRFALAHLCPDVDVVVSGINAGANLGTDLMVSGTFAAAREAHHRGLAAIAISHYRRPDVPHTWGHVAGWLCEPIRGLVDLIHRGDKSLWNVNLPAIDPLVQGDNAPSAVICPVDRTPIPLRYLPARMAGAPDVDIAVCFHVESDYHNRPRTAGSDVDICFGGRISISRAAGF
jgi:5'-nucleotidase